MSEYSRILTKGRLSFFLSRRSALLPGVALAGFVFVASAGAQSGIPVTIPAVTNASPATQSQPQTPASTQTQVESQTQTAPAAPVEGTAGQPVPTASTTFSRGRKKDDKVVPSKDTKKALDRVKKDDLLVGQDSKLPDKQLYDKAQAAIKKGHFDVARLDLQTMLNTYPDSQYQMRAKLAIADSWYREGGTAALTQAESEYADFRVFFPNVPEAAEAQMRIGDIYFRQMDKPDRDYAKALHAEEEYRRMLTDYPDSTLVPQAKQRLREVQEVLATRESDIAQYYATRDNYAAVIARDQTIVDTFPLYSHMDDVLIGLGDAYESEVRFLRTLKLPEAGKAKLEALYDGQAAAAYRKVVLEHSASLHVEDAKDRLSAMNLPVPTPSREQVAASEALENSRAQYKLVDVVRGFVLHEPDTVLASRIGDPTMTDPKGTFAPTVVKRVQDDFKDAFNAGVVPAAALIAPGTTPAAVPVEAAAVPAAGAPDTPAKPLAFENIPTSDTGAPSAATTTFSTTPTTTTGGNAAGLGVEIVTRPATTTTDTPGGLTAVGPKDASALPAAESAAAAPDRPNEINTATPPAQTPAANGKSTPQPAFDKSDESSSKHKKKKGVKKIVEPL